MANNSFRSFLKAAMPAITALALSANAAMAGEPPQKRTETPETSAKAPDRQTLAKKTEVTKEVTSRPSMFDSFKITVPKDSKLKDSGCLMINGNLSCPITKPDPERFDTTPPESGL